MWSPFGWVRNEVLTRRETPRQGIRCLLPPDQILPAVKCGVVKSGGAETRTAAQTSGGLRVSEELQRSYQHVFVTKLALSLDSYR